MKSATFPLAFSLLMLGLAISGPRSVQAQEPILESYSIGHGGNQAAPSGGVEAALSDAFFGNGTARARLQFVGRDDSGSLSLRVWRRVRRGELVFALLVFRVEVRGFDGTGELVYARDLMGFTFGDGRPGLWSEELHDLPADLGQIRVTFIGNYE